MPNQSPRLLLWLVALGFFMQTLDSTIVNTALPAMAHSLGERPLRMQSVVVAYALTMAMLIPASGWLADRFGTRRVYFSAIALFVAGSLCCAFAHNLSQLVAARVLQGAGGAMLMPVGRLAVLRAFPRADFLRAMSFVTIPALIGPLIGPALGGWIVQIASWPWIFLINVPVGAIGIIATQRFMPDSRAVQSGSFDLSGYAMLAFGMVAVSLALDGLAGLGIQTATVRVLLVFGLASIAAYALHAVRVPQPLFSPALFRVPTFSVGLLGNLFARIGSGAMPFLLPLFLQVSLDYTPFEAGLALLPMAIAGMAAKPVAQRLIKRIGYRHMLVGNTVLIGAVMASFALTSAQEPLAVRIVQLATFGFFNSMQFTAMNTVALKDLPEQHTSGGNSLLSMVMMLAMSLGVATAGALLANFEDFFNAGVAAQTINAFHATFVTVGLITLASAWIFWQLSPDEPLADGNVEHVEMG
ncbi:MAG: transporter [Verrucomicrobiaceae bacterium]|nr:transporter [Verrucomicrobiaceae bacterium]